MNKTAIKNFAVSARQNLIKAVSQKAYDIGVFADGVASITEVQGGFIYNEQSYPKDELAGRKRLVDTINLRADGKGYKHGYNQVMEEVAYTWFNRLIALRFMEVNGYLPSNIRILSSTNPDRIEPDCIREVENLDFIDKRVIEELSGETEKLYRYILIAQCNALANIMPRMFEKIADHTELLLPDSLYLREGSIVYDLVHDIDEADFFEKTVHGNTELDVNKSAVAEIIGWLYQFYISEKKDEVFAGLKKNIKIAKENIPAATQLFTPDWIVKYMVENSLGRLAVEKLNIDPAEMDWKYYLPEAEQTDEVIAQLTIINSDKKDFDIKNIKVIDPCMGSGHILVYAFDVLYQIYEKIGYVAREIPNLILENNIFGLDIDDRAGQLAYFALMMKARSYNRRFLRQDTIPQPKVYAIPESDYAVMGFTKLLGVSMSDNILKKRYCEDILYLFNLFTTSKEYGSLLVVERELDYPALRIYVDDYSYGINGQLDLEASLMPQQVEKLNLLIDVSEALTQKYDVVLTNPPYMGGSGMGAKLSEYVKKHFADSKSDLFAVFIEKCGKMLKPNGYQAMITQHAWMFLSSYEKLREKVLRRDIINMAHLGSRAFEEIGGEVVQTTAFVMRNSNVADYKASFVRLVDYNSQMAKETAFLSGGDRHTAVKENFEKIPGMPVAYWVSEKVFTIFNSEDNFENHFEIKAGICTGKNEEYIFIWYEVDFSKSNLMSKDYSFTPHNKGGQFNKWYGNRDTFLKYSPFYVQQMSCNIGFRHDGKEFYFRKHIGWSKIASSKPSFRLFDNTFTFDSAGLGLFPNNDDELFVALGLLNTKFASFIIQVLNPTLNVTPRIVKQLPFPQHSAINDKIINIVESCISISKTDWDSFETSWDFKTHPLIAFMGNYEETEPLLYADDIVEGTVVAKWSKTSAPIAQAFDAWERCADKQFYTLKSNEEELNRIFIEIYGLQDELTPEVEDKDITIRCADLGRDIRSFISYAVGCIFGRYSLDVDGLAYAGGAWDKGKYTTFHPDENNIIPITDNEYFDDDIVARFVEFVKVVYGEETLGENLDFIANALYPTGSGTAREKIRRYFINDFYKDHVKNYQKKPIYWQFDSGKQGGFKCLIYLHRYDKYTAARVRTDYLHVLQRKYEAEIKRLDMLTGMTENPREKAEYKKQIEKIEKQLTECRAYDPALAHIAHQTIELDLDDGVTVNYRRFMGIEVGVDKAVDLLTKI